MRVYFEDFLIGFSVGLMTFWAFRAWAIIIATICGILWVGGGQGWLHTKIWRRLGVPAVICSTFLGYSYASHRLHWYFILLSFVVQFGVQCCGYGIPSENPPDKGSWLGRLCGKYTRILWLSLYALSISLIFL